MPTRKQSHRKKTAVAWFSNRIIWPERSNLHHQDLPWGVHTCIDSMAIPRRRWKYVRLTLSLLFLTSLLLYVASPRIAGGGGADYEVPPPTWRPRHPSRHLLNSLSLDEDQCNAAFPGLTDDVNKTVALGAFPLKQARNFGPLQARLKDGQVSSVYRSRDKADMVEGLHHTQRRQ